MKKTGPEEKKVKDSIKGENGARREKAPVRGRGRKFYPSRVCLKCWGTQRQTIDKGEVSARKAWLIRLEIGRRWSLVRATG